MDTEQQELCKQLGTLDTVLGFLLLLVLSILLSWRASVRQRDAVCLTIQGETEKAAEVGDVTRLRLGASALVTASLGYFFLLAQETCRTADPDDPVARRSARSNLIASFLVLLAALIRLLDLNFVRRAQPVLAEELLPD